tara:strand:+ start:1049 stop:1513 length:465 start_codon:yes stop_codon:yes gene_type:complete
MSFKTLRVAGTVTATQLADDTAIEANLGKLSPSSSFRVTEFGGQDVLFLISDDYPVATSSNAFYLKAGTTTTVVPDVERALRFASEVPVAIFDDDGTSDPGANGLLLESGTVDDPGFVLYDRAETEFRISVINETATNDGAVYVEEVAQGHPGA